MHRQILPGNIINNCIANTLFSRISFCLINMLEVGAFSNCSIFTVDINENDRCFCFEHFNYLTSKSLTIFSTRCHIMLTTHKTFWIQITVWLLLLLLYELFYKKLFHHFLFKSNSNSKRLLLFFVRMVFFYFLTLFALPFRIFVNVFMYSSVVNLLRLNH